MKLKPGLSGRNRNLKKKIRGNMPPPVARKSRRTNYSVLYVVLFLGVNLLSTVKAASPPMQLFADARRRLGNEPSAETLSSLERTRLEEILSGKGIDEFETALESSNKLNKLTTKDKKALDSAVEVIRSGSIHELIADGAAFKDTDVLEELVNTSFYEHFYRPQEVAKDFLFVLNNGRWDMEAPPDSEYVTQMINRIDGWGMSGDTTIDNKISFDEFEQFLRVVVDSQYSYAPFTYEPYVAAETTPPHKPTAEQLTVAYRGGFDEFDTNEDGYIVNDEISNFWTTNKVDNHTLDTDADGRFSDEELISFSEKYKVGDQPFEFEKDTLGKITDASKNSFWEKYPVDERWGGNGMTEKKFRWNTNADGRSTSQRIEFKGFKDKPEAWSDYLALQADRKKKAADTAEAASNKMKDDPAAEAVQKLQAPGEDAVLLKHNAASAGDEDKTTLVLATTPKQEKEGTKEQPEKESDFWTDLQEQFLLDIKAFQKSAGISTTYTDAENIESAAASATWSMLGMFVAAPILVLVFLLYWCMSIRCERRYGNCEGVCCCKITCVNQWFPTQRGCWFCFPKKLPTEENDIVVLPAVTPQDNKIPDGVT